VPFRRPVPRGPRDAAVAILMFHVIGTPPPGSPYPDLWVNRATFAADVAALAHAGYHATTLDAVWRAWHHRGAMPRHPVVLSFDDGYSGQSTYARRVLERVGWPGDLDLLVHNLGVKGGLSRGEVRAMLRDGWEVDAHTMTHPDLTTVDAGRLRYEIAGSRTWLRRAFGVPVDFFCYPAGRYDVAVEDAVRAAGYDGATTEDPGIATLHDDAFALPRLRVTPEMTPAGLLALMHAVAPTSARPS
jgi:peptidoglycan/xylan/chitin deacetylase (PgdA/CDA1 family)